MSYSLPSSPQRDPPRPLCRSSPGSHGGAPLYWVPVHMRPCVCPPRVAVVQLPTLCDPMGCSMPGFPVLHHTLELAQTHIHQSVMPSNHLVLCCPLLLPPSIFPSIRVFPNESNLHIRWPKYWSFSYSIRPSNEYQD